MKNVKLFYGDCLDVMKRFPDNSIDMILCDLPYGTTKHKWDSVIDLTLLWKQYERIIKKNAAIVLFAQSPFDKVLGVSNLKLLKYEWIWEKSKATGFLNAKKYPLKAHESILVFCKGVHNYFPQFLQGKPYDKGFIKSQTANGTYGFFKAKHRKNESGKRFPRSVIYFKTSEAEGKVFHPTQKPLELCKYLINTYTKKGQIILDNACGSGTTGIAALSLNRKVILIEKEKEYFDIAKKRILEFVSKEKI